MKKVYTCFCTDMIHEGHLNILKEARKQGQVIVGVLADEAAAMDCLEAAAQESTFWSAVYNNTTAAVELSLHGNFDRTYRFTLKDW